MFRSWAQVAAKSWLSCIVVAATSVSHMVRADQGTGPGQAVHSAPPCVGMEGRLETLLPGTILDAKPVTSRSLVILRIADVRPHGTLISYDLRYVGLVPGRYDLRDYLVRKNGGAVSNLPPLPVEITGVLPEHHQGELVTASVQPFPFLGGYRAGLVLTVIIWALLIVPLCLIGRARKQVVSTPLAVAPPTLAERLRPLVQRAAEGTLSKNELAQLERMLLSHWRERLQLQQATMAEAVGQLRKHPEAGALLRELEDWLHRPPGTAQVDVAALLSPYGTAHVVGR